MLLQTVQAMRLVWRTGIGVVVVDIVAVVDVVARRNMLSLFSVLSGVMVVCMTGVSPYAGAVTIQPGSEHSTLSSANVEVGGCERTCVLPHSQVVHFVASLTSSSTVIYRDNLRFVESSCRALYRQVEIRYFFNSVLAVFSASYCT